MVLSLYRRIIPGVNASDETGIVPYPMPRSEPVVDRLRLRAC